MTNQTTQTTNVTTTNTTTVAPTKTKKLTTTYAPAKLPRKPYEVKKGLPSHIALAIMKFRREYESEGIKGFDEHQLYPTLQSTIEELREKGYTVAFKVVGNGAGYNNYCIDVSTTERTGDVLFVAHYDTVDRDVPTVRKAWNKITQKYEAVEADITAPQRVEKHVSVDGNVAYLDMTNEANKGVGCLGADDGAGLAVMLYLLRKGVLGGYCFTTGEECGGIGAEQVLKQAEPFLKYYKISVEIDRRGESEIIATQSAGECASIEFTDWLCKELGMGHKTSHLGSYTDVATFAEVIPENVNIAAGYINAHSTNEELNLEYIDQLAEKLAQVDWSKAPIKRKEGDFGYKNTYAYSDYYDPDFGYGYSTTKRTLSKTKGADTYYDELEHIAKIALQDKDFLEYLLSTGVNSYKELDEASEYYYGYPWDDVKTIFSSPITFLGM